MNIKDYPRLFEPHGSRLSPEAQVFIEFENPVLNDETRAAYNAGRVASLKEWHGGAEIADVERTEVTYRNGEYEGSGIVYRPKTKDILPMFIYYHGGGWSTLSKACYEYECAEFAASGNCVVFSFDYRLCPESRYPIPLEDCYSALLDAVAMAQKFGADPNRLAVGGDSAGGNLAAAVEMISREKGPKIKYMVLCYPAVVAGTGPNGDERDVTSVWGRYVGDTADLYTPLVSPLLDPNPEKTPPLLLVVGSCDFLIDSNLRYARKLIEAGVDAELAYFEGMPHGFIQMTIAPGVESVALITKRLKERL